MLETAIPLPPQLLGGRPQATLQDLHDHGLNAVIVNRARYAGTRLDV